MNFIDEGAEAPRGKGTFPSHRLKSKAKIQTLIMQLQIQALAFSAIFPSAPQIKA